MTAPELSEAEKVKVAAFGLDRPMLQAADLAAEHIMQLVAFTACDDAGRVIQCTTGMLTAFQYWAADDLSVINVSGILSTVKADTQIELLTSRPALVESFAVAS